MKVKELIAKLEKLNTPEADVFCASLPIDVIFIDNYGDVILEEG